MARQPHYYCQSITANARALHGTPAHTVEPAPSRRIAQQGSLCTRMQVVHANVLGVLVLHDSVHWYNYAGAGCIVAGVLLTQQGRRAVEAAEARAEAEIDGEHDDNDVIEDGASGVLESLEAQGPVLAPPSVVTNAAAAAAARRRSNAHARSSLGGW